MTKNVLVELFLPFLGTSLGAGCVFFLKRGMRPLVQRALTGFAAGVMVAASVWSLLVPAMEQAADMGQWAFLPVVALAFIAPYLASEKHIAPEVIKEAMERSLYHVRWYFSCTDLNTSHGKAQHKKAIMAYHKWYTPERERDYPASFKVDFEGQPYDGACYYRITRCPICAYAQRLGVMEIMPLLCELDEVMIRLQHGVLHREQMIASGGAYCDYFVVGDKEGHV